MNWYLKVVKEHYADFKGRARRKEYWMFVLFNLIISILIGLIAGWLGMKWLTWIYSLALFIPSLAVCVRRLHDTGRSGWWFFIVLVPIIGGIWLLVLECLDSQPEANAWGENPKKGEA